jgi:hypothetical protein
LCVTQGWADSEPNLLEPLPLPLLLLVLLLLLLVPLPLMSARTSTQAVRLPQLLVWLLAKPR